jgi:hypothetical protein
MPTFKRALEWVILLTVYVLFGIVVNSLIACVLFVIFWLVS